MAFIIVVVVVTTIDTLGLSFRNRGCFALATHESIVDQYFSEKELFLELLFAYMWQRGNID